MRLAAATCAVGAIAALAAVSAAAVPQARCEPTPNAGGGPDRGTAPLRAKIGKGHVLTGVVLSPLCRPVRGAIVSFWQSNKKGVYTPAGRGAVKTDASGRFRFEGPKPSPYEGRPAHIHIKVAADGYELLYTEYFSGTGTHGNVRLVLTPSPL
jgi:protocatechuate 3,4-dioxygenase beta subunit